MQRKVGPTLFREVNLDEMKRKVARQVRHATKLFPSLALLT
jgi:hypothetical protein